MAHDHIGFGTEPLPRSGTLLALAHFTATHTTEVLTVQQSGASNLLIAINFTKIGNAPSVVFKIQNVFHDDQGNIFTQDLLSSAAVIATGVVALQVSDRITAVTNLAANDIVADFVQVVCTHGNSDDCTYSIAAVLAP
jgi:hypothetical protein